MEVRDVIVIGAGATGIGASLWLRKKGFDVEILDRNDIASQTTYCNAATIADYACSPIPQPSVIKTLPSLLYSKDSPFVINWSNSLGLSPWLFRFLGSCTQQKYEKNAEALASLLSKTYDGYSPLLSDNLIAKNMMSSKGCLYSYSSSKEVKSGESNFNLRERLGINQKQLSREEMEALEPILTGKTAGGVHFTSSSHISNPNKFFVQLASPLIEENRITKAEVIDISPKGDAIYITSSDGRTWKTKRLIMATGVWSKSLANTLGDRIPMIAERGYHVQFQFDKLPIERPICSSENAFYMTPQSNGVVRAAGTVELSNFDPKANRKRLDYIEKHARRILETDAPVIERKLGLRPTLPDYLPVIGESSKDSRILYAFGHQHIGVTLAGITGKIVADWAKGEQLLDLSAFSPKRFL
jgi:glycine/D-amino acid oxidase-like deaminating enzyme